MGYPFIGSRVYGKKLECEWHSSCDTRIIIHEYVVNVLIGVPIDPLSWYWDIIIIGSSGSGSSSSSSSSDKLWSNCKYGAVKK